MQVVCHMPLESYRWGLQLFFGPHFNQRSTQEVMGLQSCKNLNFENFGTPSLGVPRQNDIWVQVPWLGTKNTIRGKVVASPNPGRGESCEFVFVHGSSVHQKCSNYALTNLLFGLCKSMWIIDSLVTHPSPHPGAPAHPFTPKVLQARECTPTLYPSVIFTLDSQLSLSRNLRVCQFGLFKWLVYEVFLNLAHCLNRYFEIFTHPFFLNVQK